MHWFQKTKHKDWPREADSAIFNNLNRRSLTMHLDPAVTYTDIEARHVLQPLSAVLQQAGMVNATSDARCILGLVLGRDDPVLPHEIIPRWTPDHHHQLEALWQRRQTGEPISRMRGWREFSQCGLMCRQQHLTPDRIQKRSLRRRLGGRVITSQRRAFLILAPVLAVCYWRALLNCHKQQGLALISALKLSRWQPPTPTGMGLAAVCGFAKLILRRI
jgi:hypothetical protein